jgi:hypothetical protein
MKIMSVVKFNEVQTKKFNEDVKNGIYLNINKYFAVTSEYTIRKSGFVLVDDSNKIFWFKTKIECINTMNDLLK